MVAATVAVNCCRYVWDGRFHTRNIGIVFGDEWQAVAISAQSSISIVHFISKKLNHLKLDAYYIGHLMSYVFKG